MSQPVTGPHLGRAAPYVDRRPWREPPSQWGQAPWGGLMPPGEGDSGWGTGEDGKKPQRGGSWLPVWPGEGKLAPLPEPGDGGEREEKSEAEPAGERERELDPERVPESEQEPEPAAEPESGSEPVPVPVPVPRPKPADRTWLPDWPRDEEDGARQTKRSRARVFPRGEMPAGEADQLLTLLDDDEPKVKGGVWWRRLQERVHRYADAMVAGLIRPVMRRRHRGRVADVSEGGWGEDEEAGMGAGMGAGTTARARKGEEEEEDEIERDGDRRRKRITPGQYTAMEIHGFFGLIDDGSCSQGRMLICHVPSWVRGQFLDINDGDVVHAWHVSGKTGGVLTVLSTGRHRYYSPGQRVTTCTICVPEEEWARFDF